MNQELLQKARELKLQNKSADEIKKTLAGEYTEDELDIALASLQHLKSLHDGTVTVGVESPGGGRKGSSGRVRLLILLGALISVFIAYGYGLQVKQYSEVNAVADRLKRIYDSPTVHDLGSRAKCRYLDSAGEYSLFGDTVCHLNVAKLFYPRVKVGTIRGSDRNGQIADLPWITYVDAQGRPLGEYIMFGLPGKQTWEAERQTPARRLGLKRTQMLDFSGLSGRTGGQQILKDNWQWTTSDTWISREESVTSMQDEISREILADRLPAKGAMTASEAWSQGRAPVVVYFTSRYCHSVRLALMDRVCLLPD